MVSAYDRGSLNIALLHLFSTSPLMPGGRIMGRSVVGCWGLVVSFLPC